MSKLRLWWVPQVPMEAFQVDIDSVREGAKLLDVLADYDRFQYDKHIKPDYSNAGGLAIYDEDSDEWIDFEPDESPQEQPEQFVVIVSGITSRGTRFVNIEGIYPTFKRADSAAASLRKSKGYRSAQRDYALKIHVRPGVVR